jgi:hypothetical protein
MPACAGRHATITCLSAACALQISGVSGLFEYEEAVHLFKVSNSCAKRWVSFLLSTLVACMHCAVGLDNGVVCTCAQSTPIAAPSLRALLDMASAWWGTCTPWHCVGDAHEGGTNVVLNHLPAGPLLSVSFSPIGSWFLYGQRT